MDQAFTQRRRRELFTAAALALAAALVPLVVTDVNVQNIMVLTLMYGALSQGWNILSGYCGQISLGHSLYFFINRTDFGRALEATREDAGAVALVGIDKNRVFALGWGLGAALVGLAGAIMAMFFYIYPDVGASFALIAYVTVALGGFGSVFGAFAGGIIVGLVEATTALVLPPSLKSVGIYAVYLLVVFIRPRGLFGSI